MKQTIIILITISAILALFPWQVYAAPTLVPCGRSDQQTPNNPDAQCNFLHLIILITRLINYLISVSAVVAMYHVLAAGFWLTAALGNPEKIKTSRDALTHAVVGFVMVIMAFVFINLLINGLLGHPGAQRRWWDPHCVYDILNTEPTKECPVTATGAVK